MLQAAATRHAAAAQAGVPKLPALQAPSSMRSPRGGDHASKATACRLPALAPCPRGNAQQQDMAAGAESWEGDTLVPRLPLQPARPTPKSLRLANWRQPVSARPKPSHKPAGPQQGTTTCTLGTPTAPVLAPEAASGPADETRPGPSAQEGRRDADGAPSSRSLAAQQAADDGAKAGGISWGMLVAKDTEERVRSWMREHMLLSCCLCASRSVVLVDVEEERKDSRKRDAAAEAAEVPVRTPSGEAEAQPPASAVAASPQHEVSKVQVVVGSRHEMEAGSGACVVGGVKPGKMSPAVVGRLPGCVSDCREGAA